MLGKSIYLKLYLGFFAIFVVTLIVVLLLAARFYGSHLKNEVVEYSLSEARFLRDELVQNCGAIPNTTPECRLFLNKMQKLGLLRFSLVDPAGRLLFSNNGRLPELEPGDLQRAASGEEVMSFARREPPRICLPVSMPGAAISSILVLQRAGHRDHFPRFPLAFSLLISGIVIAILVHPLSRRITRPIRDLHELARKWSEGHLEERATIRGSDEIAELGRVFNGMADNLQKMLQHKKEFLALISHELKSPVARMRIASEILADNHANDANTMNLVKGIQGDLEDSEKMIEQLLLVSRIEMDVPSAVQENIDVAALARHVVEQVKPVAGAREIQLECVCANEPAVVSGDRSELQRAIFNVLENGVKFSPDGKTVGLRVSTAEKRVLISVADAGEGIAPDDRQKIFEPFYRGRNSTGRSGSGLGLFLAKRIIEHLGGTIQVSENIPHGTVITMNLPQHQ